jgi:hypothetical protein
MLGHEGPPLGHGCNIFVAAIHRLTRSNKQEATYSHQNALLLNQLNKNESPRKVADRILRREILDMGGDVYARLPERKKKQLQKNIRDIVHEEYKKIHTP